MLPKLVLFWAEVAIGTSLGTMTQLAPSIFWGQSQGSRMRPWVNPS